MHCYLRGRVSVDQRIVFGKRRLGVHWLFDMIDMADGVRDAIVVLRGIDFHRVVEIGKREGRLDGDFDLI